MLGFKKYVIDTNAFTGIIGTEGKQRVAISHLIVSHDLSTILNNIKTNTTSFDEDGNVIPRFTFQTKGISLLEHLTKQD